MGGEEPVVGESVGGATGSPTWFPLVPPNWFPHHHSTGGRLTEQSSIVEAASVKMWCSARLSVALPVVILQLLASSTHARPQTGHQVLFWIQIQSFLHCIAICCNCKLILKCMGVQVGSDDRASRVLVPSAVPNCDSVFRRSLPECQQKVYSAQVS